MLNSEILREKLEKKSLVQVVGAYDALSAKLVETYDFDAVWAGSFAISATHALPDASILTMTEFLSVTSNMAEACNIPVIADCDTGYGGPSNVSHMVKKYEKAGVAAVCIEDKTFPKQNSLLKNGKQELLSEKDFVAKIIAAREAKRDSSFMIIARIESLIARLGMDDAIARANAYEKAGADAIVIHSKEKTPDEIFEFCKIWKGTIPIVVIPTSYGNVTTEEMIEHKIKMVIYANQTLRTSHIHISKLLGELKKNNSLDKITQEMSTMEDIFKLQQMYGIKKEEEDIQNELKKMGYID
ncbi:MAG: phosphoenolpyruvate phosphomutase [Chloroflexi bacterium]|nr:phosphoenolpyruvate phosphomutase [Chloroflexota bacterium]|tara:strand:- start:18809 stop:19705 length:897 start_codon:yes stop_codon:yes gene_type:complete